MGYRFAKAALGGTFDHLHLGHEHLLNTALDSAERLVVGLTTPDMVREKVWPELVESYEARKQSLMTFFGTHMSRVEIVPLTDVYGTTLTDSSIEGLVVTEQTKSGAEQINTERENRALAPLPVVVTDLVKDTAGEYISSTRIRSGAIDRQGLVYRDVLQRDYHLSSPERQTSQTPQGKMMTDVALADLRPYTRVALVGDVVTGYFMAHNLPFDYGVVDGMSGRKPIPLPNWSGRTVRASNPAGVITREAGEATVQLLSQPKGLLQIEGEEDLLGFPLGLLLPLSSVVIYGQPNSGMVLMEITEAKKAELVTRLKGMR